MHYMCRCWGSSSPLIPSHHPSVLSICLPSRSDALRARVALVVRVDAAFISAASYALAFQYGLQHWGIMCVWFCLQRYMLSPFSMGFSIGVLCVFRFVCSVICFAFQYGLQHLGTMCVWFGSHVRAAQKHAVCLWLSSGELAQPSGRGAEPLLVLIAAYCCVMCFRPFIVAIAVPFRPGMLWASALGTMCVWFASKASVRLDETIHDASPSPSSKASRKRPLSPPASPPTQEPAAASAASKSVGFIILCLTSREVRRLAASRYGTSFSCITYADQRSYVSHLNRGETISVLPSITAYCVTSSVWTPLDLSTNGTWL